MRRKGSVNTDDEGFFLGATGPGNKHRQRQRTHSHE